MILTKLLGTIGLPVLLKFVKNAIGNIDDDVAKEASSSLTNLDKAIEEKKISLAAVQEANRNLERMQQLEGELDIKTLTAINETIRQELESTDRFVRFWRPFFGYSVSITWFAMMLTICYVILSGKENAAEIIMALVETTSLWGIALGVLGISVVKRTQEKQSGKQPEDVLSKIVNKII